MDNLNRGPRGQGPKNFGFLAAFQLTNKMPPQEKRLKFVEGERVLCFHGPLLYEAVIKGQLRDKVTKYLIHYNGWNKNWDEWVTESRVMKYCEENLKKQKELKQQHVLVRLFISTKMDRPHGRTSRV